MTVKELIALGFGGYAGWNDLEASNNFRDTGGAGKFTGLGVQLDPFVKKWNGKGCDFDGNKRFWCVDPIRMYMKDVLKGNGYQLPSVSVAKQLYLNFTNTKDFTQIPNAAYNSPIKGDIIVFRPYPFVYGYEGHVAIVLKADSKSITVLEQNFPTGTKMAIHTRGYGIMGRAVYGWLRPNIKIA